MRGIVLAPFETGFEEGVSMWLATVSDLHLGAVECALLERDPLGKWRTSDVYTRLVATIRDHDAAHGELGVDYLVLLGDVMDQSVASQSDAYEAARVFFRALAAEKTAANAYLIKQLVYVVGNHDYSVWGTVMHQANVVNPLENGLPVRDRWSSPGFIDYRALAGADRGRLHLAKVTKRPDGGYGGTYLDALTRTEGRQLGHEPRLVFNVVYPNLYVVDSERTTLLTHGHYLESPWAMSGNLVRRIAADDLQLLGRTEPSIDDIVALNLPFAELTSASLGMSGPLVPLARLIQREYKSRNADAGRPERSIPTLRKYIGRLKALIDAAYEPGGTGFAEKVSDVVLDRLEEWAVQRLQRARPARDNADFPESGLVQSYHCATDLERDSLARDHALAVPEVTHMICAHSHCYVAWGDAGRKNVEIRRHDMSMPVANTGGWLCRHRDHGRDRDHDFQGGVFFYDEHGWSSTVLTH